MCDRLIAVVCLLDLSCFCLNKPSRGVFPHQRVALSSFPGVSKGAAEYLYMAFFFLIHSIAEGHLGCFQFLATKNKTARNIVEQVSLWYSGASFGYMLRSGIAGS